MSTEDKNAGKRRLKELATALGYVEVMLRQAGAPDDTREGACAPHEKREVKVKVWQLPVKKYREMAAALDDEIALAALYCRGTVDKDSREWAESLTPASHEKVIETGKDINWDFFCSWVARQQERATMRPKQDPEEMASVWRVIAQTNPEFIRELSAKVLGAAKPIEGPSIGSGLDGDKK